MFRQIVQVKYFQLLFNIANWRIPQLNVGFEKLKYLAQPLSMSLSRRLTVHDVHSSSARSPQSRDIILCRTCTVLDSDDKLKHAPQRRRSTVTSVTNGRVSCSNPVATKHCTV